MIIELGTVEAATKGGSLKPVIDHVQTGNKLP